MQTWNKITNNDNIVYTDRFEVFKLFKTFFFPVSYRIHESLPPPLSEEEFSYYLRDVHVDTSSDFSSTQTIEVESTLLSAVVNKSHISTHPNKILKFISNLVSSLLTSILNKSLTTRFFSMSSKTTQIVPIFKAGDRRSLNNYRPTSIFHVFSKIFQRIVHNYNLFRSFWTFRFFTFWFSTSFIKLSCYV